MNKELCKHCPMCGAKGAQCSCGLHYCSRCYQHFTPRKVEEDSSCGTKTNPHWCRQDESGERRCVKCQNKVIVSDPLPRVEELEQHIGAVTSSTSYNYQEMGDKINELARAYNSLIERLNNKR